MRKAIEAFNLSTASANKVLTVNQEIEHELESIIQQAISNGRFDAFTVYHSPYKSGIARDILVKNGYNASIIPHAGRDIVSFSWRNV